MKLNMKIFRLRKAILEAFKTFIRLLYANMCQVLMFLSYRPILKQIKRLEYLYLIWIDFQRQSFMIQL